MRKAYILNLEDNGQAIELHLRLNIFAQKKLINKYKESTLDIILAAAEDPVKLTDILTESLTYKGNKNAVQNGEELYELIVDNGFGGPFYFMELVVGIAGESGILSKEQADQLIENARDLGDKAFINEEEVKN